MYLYARNHLRSPTTLGLHTLFAKSVQHIHWYVFMLTSILQEFTMLVLQAYES